MSDMWKDGRETTTWALKYAEKKGNGMSKPTCISLLENKNLGVKIAGRWKVSVFRWKEHIENGTDFSEKDR